MLLIPTYFIVPWCKLFYENQTEFEVFYDNIINGTFSTLRTRINEFPATIQWIEIIRNRRKGGEFEGISEKEFLLSHSTKVKKYQDFVSMGEDNEFINTTQWIGTGEYVEFKSKNNNQYEIVIKHSKWQTFIKTNVHDDSNITFPSTNDNIYDHPATRSDN